MLVVVLYWRIYHTTVTVARKNLDESIAMDLSFSLRLALIDLYVRSCKVVFEKRDSMATVVSTRKGISRGR